MPTALMENLLENDGLNKVVDKKKMKYSRGSSSNAADDDGSDVSSGDEDEIDGNGNVRGESGDEEEMEDEEDEVDDDDDRKIPKKTEIFEGKVVQVEKLVKEEEEMRSQ